VTTSSDGEANVRYWSAIGAAVAVAVAAAGCGSSSKNTTTGSAAATSSSPSRYSTPNTASTASSAATQAPAGPAVAIQAKHNKLGTILAAGAKRMTVYLFEGDKGSESACSAACAQVWPPVTVASAASAGAGATGADLGTITRSDGTKQVTYKGHPLYFYAKDGDSGDAYGQGIKSFGSDWYVLAPSGKKIDES
jgi:predicted lipoprotein with Yx(FWY)xxD motif